MSSSMRQRNAPLPSSSILLEKRWRDHDYQIHQMKLRALRGDLPQRPTHTSHGVIPKTPGPQKQERSSKSAKARPSNNTGRPTTSRPVPQRNTWVKSAVKKPSKSEYSAAALNDHYKRHQYYRNVILKRQGLVPLKRKRVPKPKPEPEYSDSFEESPEPSPVPTPTPGEKFFLDEDQEDEEPSRSGLPDKAPAMTQPGERGRTARFYHPVRIYQGHSSSDSWSSSDDEPDVIMRDGKPGQKYVLRGNSDEEEERKDELKDLPLTKQYLEREPSPVLAFDPKNDQRSELEIDDFGRPKRLLRPMSAMTDTLPAIRAGTPDSNDTGLTMERVSRDTLRVREALFQEEEPDLDVLVNTILDHNTINRRWMRKMYRDEYLTSLLRDIKRQLPADIASIVSHMMLSHAEYDAMCLWDALKGLHKDTEVLVEILCTRSNAEMSSIRKSYEKQYSVDLLDSIEDETTGLLQRILMILAMGERMETQIVDKAEANHDAKAIDALLESKGDYMDKKCVYIFTKYGHDQLRLVFNEYRKLRNKDMETSLVEVYSGNELRCFLTIMSYIQNPPGYFVEKLHSSHYSGNDDDKVVERIVISREGRDFHMIKELFHLRYDMILLDYMSNTCNSRLRSIMLRIVAGKLDDEQRKTLNLPSLIRDKETVSFSQRLSLKDAITIVMRKTQVIRCLFVLLNIRRQKMKGEEEGESEVYELEPEEEEPEEDVAPEPQNEEDSSDEDGKDELRDELRNLDLTPAAGEDSSAFAGVSLSLASRGIMKQPHAGNRGDDGDEEDDPGLGPSSGPSIMKVNPGPVLDPTVMDGGDVTFIQRMMPFLKGRKKKYFRGTVKGVPMDDFNAMKDAQAIGRAFLNQKRNIAGILRFLLTRNNSQRQLIVREFFRRYRRDLVEDLRRLNPSMADSILGLLLAPEIYQACTIYEGLKRGGDAKYDVLIEILCSTQGDDIAIIKRAFNGVFELDLIEQVSNECHGWFKEMMVNILKCNRDESDFVDPKYSERDAALIYEASVKKTRDFTVYIDILTTRSFPQLKDLFMKYARITGFDILETLEEQLEGDFLDAATAIVCNVRDAPVYFSERIYQAISLHPMDEKGLIRSVIMRSEIDLMDIKISFKRTYGRSLYNMIQKEVVSAYGPLLMEIIGS